MMRNVVLALLSLIICTALSGCSKGRPEPKRVPVTGTVTLDGKPMAEGTIYFKTIGLGSVDRMDIKEGKFEGMAEVGQRRVEINQIKSGPPIRTPLGDLPNVTNKIPSKYNTQSTLTATVTDEGPNEFKFEATSN